MSAVVRHGDDDAGAILIKVNRFGGGCLVYSQTRDHAGEPAWMIGSGPQAVSEDEAEDYIERQVSYDADVWVIEVEDPKGTYNLPENVVEA